ncbi:MAG TPA: hypothetical protein VF888_02560 [Nitrospirota bacterium]
MYAIGRGKHLEARENNSSRQDSWSPAREEATAKEVRGDMRVEEYVDRIAEEMHERVEFQRRLFKQVLAGGGNALDCPAYCPLVDCPRLSKLQGALRETIEIFEETRSSFKSKKLEVMRKRLIDILAGS